MHLEDSCTTLSVASQTLLRNYIQRVALATANGMSHSIVQFRLVWIVGVGGGIVLGHHGDVICRHTKLSQVAYELRMLATLSCRQSTQTWSWNRGVSTVCEGANVSNHTSNWQTELQRDVTASHQNGTTTLCFNESATTTIVCTGEEASFNTLVVHLLRVCCSVHVAETVHRFGTNIVNSTSYHEISLAQLNLVEAFFDRYCCGCACRYWLNHVAVTANVGLHHMSGNHIWQSFLQNIAWIILVQVAIQVELAHRRHTTEACALRAGHLRWVNRLQNLCRCEACRNKGIYSCHNVPQCNLIHISHHGAWNTPTSWVEAFWELTTYCACHGCAAWNVNGSTLYAGNNPLAIFFIKHNAGMCFVCIHIFTRGLLISHSETNVVVEEDFSSIFIRSVSKIIAHTVIEWSNTASSHNLVMEAFVNISFWNNIAVHIVPAWFWSVCPRNQAHIPR